MPVIEHIEAPKPTAAKAGELAENPAVIRLDCIPRQGAHSYSFFDRVLNAAISISFFPSCQVRTHIVFPSDFQAIEDDWKAVGQDLYTAIEQYKISEPYLHARTAPAKSDKRPPA